MAVTFDLFGTLVHRRPGVDPSAILVDELDARGIEIPSDWKTAYGTHRRGNARDGREYSLPDHVHELLRRRGIDESKDEILEVCVAAFENAVVAVPEAAEVIRTVGASETIGLFSNCSVPGLVQRVMMRSSIPISEFSTVLTSVDCGWRKPHPNAFTSIANMLETDPSRCIHVGDDPITDGGISALGGRFVLVDAHLPLRDVPERLERISCHP